jgi:arylsulfatase A-like enzyme
MADQLSVILIQIDSLNRHLLTCYDNDWVQTPNLTAFAQKAAVFDQHFAGSLPCMPARREIWSGTEEFWWRGWGPLEPWDLSIPYLAGQRGVTTQFITDHYHLFEWGSHNYNYDFDGYTFIRGHEFDNWRTDPVSEIPDWAQVMVQRHIEEVWQYIRNVQDFQCEADFFAPRLMTSAADWLERNRDHQQFYLHIDSFDVHEPFHIPEPYRSMYTDDDYRQYSPWPIYGRTDEGRSRLDPAEVAWVRAQFAGKLTMVDRWLGRIFDRLTDFKLWDRTAVIITTDHGFFLGEHGWMGKNYPPMYHTVANIPLLVWHPDGALNGQRVPYFTQTVDLYATVLELLGIDVPDTPNIHSRSFAKTITSGTPTTREHAIYGYNNSLLGITNAEWTLLRDHDKTAAPAYIHTHQIEQMQSFGLIHRKYFKRGSYGEIEAGHFIPGVDFPVWRMRKGPEQSPIPADPSSTRREDLLFHNPTDAGQEHNRADEHGDIVRTLEDALRDHMQALDVPAEQYARLHLIQDISEKC